MAEGKAVKLETVADGFRRDTRAAILRVARERPDSCVIVYVKDDQINVSVSAMSRLKVMGALHYAMSETWEA